MFTSLNVKAFKFFQQKTIISCSLVFLVSYYKNSLFSSNMFVEIDSGLDLKNVKVEPWLIIC